MEDVFISKVSFRVLLLENFQQLSDTLHIISYNRNKNIVINLLCYFHFTSMIVLSPSHRSVSYLLVVLTTLSPWVIYYRSTWQKACVRNGFSSSVRQKNARNS